MAIEMQKENQDWITDFIEKYKRKPRILHISNVANNAYNNAKLLTEAGIENHVLAHNAFYAMGCPEWEDAEFSNEVTNMWNPDWFQFNLNGFSRPRWFAQGEFITCIRYLKALCDGNKEEANSLFTILSQQNKTKITTENKNAPMRLIALSKKMFSTITGTGFRMARRAFTKVDSYCNTSLVPTLIRIKYLKHSKSHHLEDGSENYSTQQFAYDKWDVDTLLVSEFKKEFPDRQDQLTEKDFIAYYSVRPDMLSLLKRYDIVIGYALEGLYPLMFGKPYFAFEHGTIRDIPYAPDPQGRFCALVYRKATHAFVTNVDCIPSANYLSPEKYSVINHPYDEDQPLAITEDWQQERNDLMQELQANMILFHPTRHDWVEGTGYADKANDVFLQTFASLRQQGLRLGLVCCEWGANTEESKKLLDHLGVSKHVRWIKPLGVMAYTRMCKIADIVVDQFKLGGFGGVAFKALATGTPVMAYVDLKQISSRYAEPPPIINCQTAAEITQQLSRWYDKMHDLEALGIKGRVWMKKFHNKSETVNIQMEQFRRHFPIN